MNGFKQNIKKYFIGFSIFLLLVNILLLWLFGLSKTEAISLISASIALFAAVLASIAIVYQLKSNNEWNQRHTALTEVYNREAFSKALKVLEKNIEYNNLTGPISDEDIHIHLCGEKDCTGPLLSLTKNGLDTRNSIMIMLNYYEYLAIGIKSNILDEKVVKEMINESLLNAYNVFSIYINHLRKRHNRAKAFVDLEELAIKWTNEDKPKYEKRESTV